MMYQENYRPKGDLPKIPMIRVIVKSVDDHAKRESQFVIDSGADLTLISRDLFGKLGITRKGERPLGDAKGKTTMTDWCLIKIELPQLVFEKRIEAFVTESDTNFLGRDVINAFCMVLNGKQNLYKIYDFFLNFFLIL